jgi:hypothetical protein
MYIDVSSRVYTQPMECVFLAPSIQPDDAMAEPYGNANDMNKPRLYD